MDSQRIARLFGLLYVTTIDTSIPALILFQPILDDPVGYVANDSCDNRSLY